jgi:hypothetical protein
MGTAAAAAGIADAAIATLLPVYHYKYNFLYLSNEFACPLGSAVVVLASLYACS